MAGVLTPETALFLVVVVGLDVVVVVVVGLDVAGVVDGDVLDTGAAVVVVGLDVVGVVDADVLGTTGVVGVVDLEVEGVVGACVVVGVAVELRSGPARVRSMTAGLKDRFVDVEAFVDEDCLAEEDGLALLESVAAGETGVVDDVAAPFWEGSASAAGGVRSAKSSSAKASSAGTSPRSDACAESSLDCPLALARSSADSAGVSWPSAEPGSSSASELDSLSAATTSDWLV